MMKQEKTRVKRRREKKHWNGKTGVQERGC